MPIPAGAKIIDLSHETVLPGLIDTHVHVMDNNPLLGPGVGPNGPGPSSPTDTPLQYRELVAMVNAQHDLNAGFTTIVDLMSHGGGYGTVDLRNAINRGLVVGPRMQVAGPGIVTTNKSDATFPVLPGIPIINVGAQIADGPWEARKAVREQAHYGVDWIKIYSSEAFTITPDGKMNAIPTFTLEETRAIVDEAHRNGLKVACHVYGDEGLHNCIEAGVDVPTHGIELDDQSLKMLLAKHLPLTTTILDLAVYAPDDLKNLGHSRWEIMQKSWKKAHDAGVVLPFGSGAAPFQHGLQGIEFAYLVKWGMTPTEALQSATTRLLLVQILEDELAPSGAACVHQRATLVELSQVDGCEPELFGQGRHGSDRVLIVARQKDDPVAGLTYTQCIAMVALSEQGDQTVGALGEKLFLESNTLTPILKKLEQTGYISRVRDAADERQVRVSLTAAGRRLLENDPGGALVEACGLGDEFSVVQKTVVRLRDNLVRNTRGKPDET